MVYPPLAFTGGAYLDRMRPQGDPFNVSGCLDLSGHHGQRPHRWKSGSGRSLVEIPLMKTFLFIGFIFLSGWHVCFAQEISKAEILATVRHMQSLAADQKKALLQAQTDFTEQASQLQEQTLLTAKFHKEASDNARQRDVILYLWAIAAGFYVGTLFGGEVLRQFPFPYGLIACTAVYLLSGLAAYTLGRVVLGSLAHFLP